jgi:lysophospholipase L1-like esterase
LLGDSVVFGYGVPEESTVRSQLETRLNEMSGDRRFEVWNLGVPASDTHNQAARFRRLAPSVKPDLTVVLVLYNDLIASPTSFRISSVGTLSRSRRSAPYPDAWRPALEASAVFQLALKAYGALFSPDRPFTLDAYPEVRTNLRMIVQEQAAHGGRTIVALVPSLNVPRAEHVQLARLLHADFGDSDNGDFIDLGVVLEPLGKEAFLPGDQVHLNADAYSIVADTLLPLLRAFIAVPS